MKNIAVLGSTGSIGQNTLEVVKHFPDKFRVTALSANSNDALLYKQIKLFRPEVVCLTDKHASLNLKAKVNRKIKVLAGQDGLLELCRHSRIDKFVLAISGSGALKPLLEAIKTGREIALANKEALVMAGPIIMREARRRRVSILPIDSEQSAIWQCLDKQDKAKLKNIYLTASGGPLRQARKKELSCVSVHKVLKHPCWKMGKKISVDSATLMNKGLEVLETMFLFNVDIEKIRIIIHPQAIIHSMVEFVDGVILAQLSVTDMRIPIQYALSYPERMPGNFGRLEFQKLRTLNFQKPDFKKFPCLELAYYAGRRGGTLPCVLNAANEVCVEEFLKGKLDFISIARVISKVVSMHRKRDNPDMDEILEADSWARIEARNFSEGAK